jgi:Spy/CpxP family protein refolding chaperone
VFIRTVIAVGAAAIIIGAGVAVAQQAPPPAGPAAVGAPAGEHHRGGGFARLLKSLNLSADQKTKIEAIQAKYRQQNANVTDPEQRHANMKAQRDEIVAVLTPQQKEKLQTEIQQMRARWQNQQGTPSR